MFFDNNQKMTSFFSLSAQAPPTWVKDTQAVDKIREALRLKIVAAIQTRLNSSDYSVTELAHHSKTPKPTLAKIKRNECAGMSSDRLLGIALCLGIAIFLKTKLDS